MFRYLLLFFSYSRAYPTSTYQTEIQNEILYTPEEDMQDLFEEA